MNSILAGATVMGYVVAGLFFLKFWARTRDALFISFSVAFWILAGQRLALALAGDAQEGTTIFYVLRLLAFLIIIYAIWQKNRVPRRGDGTP